MSSADPFTVGHDPERALIVVTMHDFWTVETVDAYGAALGPVIGAALSAGGPVALLIDCMAYPVQSAAVAERFVTLAATFPPPSPDGVRAVAIVVGSMLNKMQAQRTFGPMVTIFTDHDEAAASLMG